MNTKTEGPVIGRSTAPRHKSPEGVGCRGSFVFEEEKTGYKFEKCELCGKKQTVILASPPPKPHIDERGKRCTGTFKFPKTGVIPGERVCNVCCLVETYELNLFLVIAREGIYEDDLREICDHFHGEAQVKAEDRKVIVLSEKGRTVAVVSYPGIGKEKDVEEFFRIAVDEELYRDTIAGVFRISAKLDSSGCKIEKQKSG